MSAHELRITVNGDDAKDIEAKARTLGEAYFGKPVRLVTVDVVGESYEFGTGAPRFYRAAVLIEPDVLTFADWQGLSNE